MLRLLANLQGGGNYVYLMYLIISCVYSGRNPYTFVYDLCWTIDQQGQRYDVLDLIHHMLASLRSSSIWALVQIATSSVVVLG